MSNGRTHRNGVLGCTTTACPVCRAMIPAKVTMREGAVWFSRFCPEHGARDDRVHGDAATWLANQRHVKAALVARSHDGDAALPCPEGCGHCARHEQHLCMPILEITDRCDLACPICIAEASGAIGHDLDPRDVDRALGRVIAAEGQIDVLNFSGGEPLLHPRLLEIIDGALARPEIVRVSVSTNGLRLLEDPGLLPALAARRVTVSLQFDGFDDAVYRRLRGRPLAAAKRAILDRLAAERCSTSLVTTLARGLNEDALREALDLLFDHEHIVSLMIQPLALAGRAGGGDPSLRLDTSAVIAALTRAGHPCVYAEDFSPLPCSHPNCFALAFYLAIGPGAGVSINRLVPAHQLMDLVANRTVFGLDADEHERMKDLVYEIWSGPAGQMPDTEAVLKALRALLRELSCSCFDPRSAFALAERSAKSIFIHAFQDPITFDLARIRRCCNAYILPDGRQMPACAYNVCHRSPCA